MVTLDDLDKMIAQNPNDVKSYFKFLDDFWGIVLKHNPKSEHKIKTHIESIKKGVLRFTDE